MNDLMSARYFDHMVGRLYKILPLKESAEETLPEYLDGLYTELAGIERVTSLSRQPYYVSIVGIVSFLAGNISTCDIKKVKRDVFRAINLCKKLERIYQGGDYNAAT